MNNDTRTDSVSIIFKKKNQVQKDGQKITVLLQILFVKADCPYKGEENNMPE